MIIFITLSGEECPIISENDDDPGESFLSEGEKNIQDQENGVFFNHDSDGEDYSFKTYYSQETNKTGGKMSQ